MGSSPPAICALEFAPHKDPPRLTRAEADLEEPCFSPSSAAQTPGGLTETPPSEQRGAAVPEARLPQVPPAPGAAVHAAAAVPSASREVPKPRALAGEFAAESP